MTEARGAGRILVVEDSPTQAIRLRLVLQHQGYEVTCAATAEAALESLNERIPDLVIADFHLPGMNGDGLARQIRMNVRTRTLPVLMLTEAREREVERQGIESGADAYVSKGAAEDLLLLRIRALLRRGQTGYERGEGDGPSDGPPRAFHRASLMIVADDEAAAARIGAAFAREAYLVSVRSDPAVALAAVRSGEAGTDCVVVDLSSTRFDGTALLRDFDRLRTAAAGLADGAGPGAGFILVAVECAAGDGLEEAYVAGADDVVPPGAEAEALALRIWALVRRKQLQDDNRRIESELRERRVALERAQAEAAAAEARAAIAGELEQANRELATANQRLVETQGQLVHAAKMASLGELVAGIAHEINNPLAFILAHHGTVARSLASVAPRVAGDADAASRIAKAQDRLQTMAVGLQRIQELVLNLRKFSRLDEGTQREIDVPSAIETVLTLLSHKIRDGVTVTRRFEAAPKLMCSPALLNQVVMNVVGNAIDAVGAEGTIEIATRSDDDWYTFIVADDGPGVPPALRDRVFEPFFTTKPVGSGTGLGLAISYGVVMAHKGEITVADGPAGGARFVIRVPRRRA